MVPKSDHDHDQLEREGISVLKCHEDAVLAPLGDGE